MGSYAGLYVKSKLIFSFKNESYESFGRLFSAGELIYLSGEEALPLATNWVDIDPEEVDHDEVEVYAYGTEVGVLKDRMMLMGFTPELAREVFEEQLIEKIDTNQEMIDKHLIHGRDDKLIDEMKRENAYMEKLTYDVWCKAVVEWLQTNDDYLKRSLGRSVIESPLTIVEYCDERLVLRMLIDHLGDDENITLDLTDVYQGGWVDDGTHEPTTANERSFNIDALPPIVITEGIFDTNTIKDMIEIRKPHIKDNIRFLDYEQKAENGAAAAVRLVKGLASAGVTNRVLAIFDNDTAAHEATHELKRVSLPKNFKIMFYPEIDLARNYPTIGAQGQTLMDVNGVAASVELFLGRDVLTDKEGNLRPVQWKNMSQKLKKYQGEVSDKSIIQAAFKEKINRARKQGVSSIEDWHEADVLIEAILNELSILEYPS